MSLIGRALGLQPQAVNMNDERIWSTYVGLATSAGVRVDADSAMRVSAVWGCVRLISESLATLPLKMFRHRPDGGRDEAPNHPLWEVLHSRPNASQTAMEFVEMMTGHALLRGNGYAEIVPGPRGPVDQLIPLHPDRMERVEKLSNGTFRYHYRQDNNQPRVYLDDEIFHLRGLSNDGIVGVSVIEYAKESIALAMAAEGFGARFFKNDSRPGGVLRHPGKLSEPVADRLKRNWESLHQQSNQHRVAVLEEGMEWQQVGIAPEDAQFLQTREFQVTDIARWFRVPLHMIQETSKSTSWGSGIEQLSLAFVVFTLMPWAVRWEQAISRDLILAPQVYYAKFLLNALARGDLKSRFDSYAVGRQWGWLSVNDVRSMEEMNPIEGGDRYMVPLNMADALNPPAQRPDDRMDDSQAHYDFLLREAAARIVRKEIAALTKAEKRCAGDAEALKLAVAQFYADHAAFVAQTLGIDLAQAEHYVAQQKDIIQEAGIQAIIDTETEIVAYLIGLVTGVQDV